MTFNELVAETCERLNLTSDEAKSRVGRELNARYRRLTSSIGLVTSRRTQVPGASSIGSPMMTWSLEKVLAVIDKSSGIDVMLSEVTPDEMHILPLTDKPKHYAIMNMHSASVETKMDCVPTISFLLFADGIESVVTLAGGQSPDFPESFHDVLIFGAMADEYRKMEKLQFATAAEADYTQRLSDLRMFIAKSAYLDQYQGRYAGRSFRWTRNSGAAWD